MIKVRYYFQNGWPYLQKLEGQCEPDADAIRELITRLRADMLASGGRPGTYSISINGGGGWALYQGSMDDWLASIIVHVYKGQKHVQWYNGYTKRMEGVLAEAEP